MGHPVLLDLRLAAPVLFDERRVRRDLQGARRDDRLGQVRPRSRPALRELHELDEVATFLWAQLAKERSVADLVAALSGEFEVEAGTAETDVREFLSDLEAKGLVLRA